ncbi:hypothetical protein PHYBOEH_005584 [Phytophthora boehmeriae]|uniref:Uncharacterized protein n=1 Tax=Phytophthora boehmeriae TaxID=109152 RepID=A0A8T1WLT6_9STRA|nr:hypothetical protein PHYBOEH_005584 [Phytophthora boehmeriae]
MRLYVHLEAADEAESWTKRLKLPPVDDPDASPSIRSVLLRFISAHTAKFRPNRPLNLSDLDVYVEFQQNAASRRLLPSLDASMALIKDSRDGVMVQEEETCSFELVVIPRTPQRKVLGPPPPLPVQKTSSKCPIQAENRRDGRDPNLQAVLELAAANMKNKKFRLARELYRTVVLPADPENPEALLALGDILMANGQFEAAANEYFLKCWIVHGPTAAAATAEREVGVIEPITASKEDAKLASSSALRLAECYIEMQNHQQALGILDELHAFLHGNDALGRGKAKNEINSFPLGTEERLLTEAQMDVLKARALYNTNIPDNQEKAISLITHLLPNLQAPVLNLDALLVYARIADDRGKKSEALVMVLQVLVGKSKDRAVKETLVSMLKDVGSMERLQQTIPPTSPSAGAAYAYIATILKDFGAIDNSIVCFQQAQESVFYPKVNFWRVISSIPMKARVIFLFGEIDCREGILEAVEKCKYESIEEGMKHTIAIFMDTLAAVVEKYEFEACIHPVVPVLDETRGMVVQYNKLFQKQVASSRICKWLDFFDDLVYQSPYKLRPEFRLDGTHLHPSYLVHLEDALSKL